jgi:hypothetical protein
MGASLNLELLRLEQRLHLWMFADGKGTSRMFLPQQLWVLGLNFRGQSRVFLVTHSHDVVKFIGFSG